MKFHLALSVLLTLASVLAGNSDDERNEGATEQQEANSDLDIMSYSKFEKVVSERKVLDNIDYEQMRIREGVKVTRIKENNVTMWENEQNPFLSGSVTYHHNAPVLLSVVEENVEGKKHYKKENGSWTQTTEEIYNEKIRQIRDLTPTLSYFPLNLRLALENEKYLVEKFTRNYVNLIVYTPKMGHRAKYVFDETSLIWKGTLAGERCVTALAYTKGDVPLLVHLFVVRENAQMENLYYRRQGGTWLQLNEDQYLVDVLSMRYDNDEIKPVEMNLDHIDQTEFDVRLLTYERPYITYTPKEPGRVTRLTTDQQVIWESPDPALTFAYSVSYFDQGGAPLVKLNLNNKPPAFFVAFIRTQDGWEETDDFEIEDRIINIQSSRYMVLDLSYIEEDKLSCLQMRMENVDYMLITPRMGHDIMIIKDEEEKIWEYKGLEEQFSNGWVYFHEGRPVLFHFRIRNPMTGHTDHYCVKRGPRWHQTTKEGYLKSINHLVYSSKQQQVTTEQAPEPEPAPAPEPQEDVATLLDGAQAQEPVYEEMADLPHGEPVYEEPVYDEIADEPHPEAGFKEKLYSKYADPSYDPTDDEDTLNLLAMEAHKDGRPSSCAPSEESQILEEVSWRMEPSPDESWHTGPPPEDEKSPSAARPEESHTWERDGAQSPLSDLPEEKAGAKKVRFEHIDPRDIRESRHMLRQRPSRLPHSSMEDLGSLTDDEFEQTERITMKRYKSTPELMDKYKRRWYARRAGYELLSDSDDSDSDSDGGKSLKGSEHSEESEDSFKLPSLVGALTVTYLLLLL